MKPLAVTPRSVCLKRHVKQLGEFVGDVLRFDLLKEFLLSDEMLRPHPSIRSPVQACSIARRAAKEGCEGDR